MTLETTARQKIRLLTAGVLAATFVLGAVTGGGIWSWFLAERLDAPRHHLPPGPWPLGDLELSDAQRTRIQEICERHRPKLDAVLRESFPLVRVIQEEIDREIREVLTPEQRDEFDRLKVRRPFPPPRLPPPLGAGAPPEPPAFPPPVRSQ